ncbi:class I glutamine amidotransferase-like protein [Dissoconium aciculare CBS 342.82]|uniref:Class I glutamine amidotransferase-like protein n=1 Tax=Dissoconium aciculare CBS 342.82 TaxID=1314786 RepID=A0A6J3M5A7_9PEZI|nr:class I glutamine amidotransferase-like protein [Dissoconium aciculare CBS 342.82]KAF1822032.1 class I glutamine amidotransferase-like protein [Dissoconium aciculare CBS 342.82]
MGSKVVFLLADYGHDPTETAVPYKAFVEAGFQVTFFTENGNVPKCDAKMLEGITGTLLGAPKAAVEAYKKMTQSTEWQNPKAWTSEGISLLDYDLLMLPGGHEKGVRQILDSPKAQALIAEYFPACQKPGKKATAAICHGVQALAHTKGADGNSVIHEVNTTALPGVFENAAYHSTRLFLGDYYKTYGAGTANVEEIVKAALRDPAKQWKSSANPAAPFLVENQDWNYISGRWPGDAPLLAESAVKMVQQLQKA